MIKNRAIVLCGLIALAFSISACTGNDPAAKSANSASNTVAENTNAANTASSETAISDDSAAGSLASPSDAYRTFWDLRSKKDVEGLKKILSKEILEFFKEVGEAEGKSLDDEIRELANRPQAAKPEVRNEKIDGDRASVEYLEHDGTWKPMDFEKEDGVWKPTIPKMDPKDLEIQTKP
jgi:hypothetical protein